MGNNNKNSEHVISYGKYVLVWIALLALTSLTVTVAGINFGNYSLFVALLIAAAKAFFVIEIFMHIKVEDPIFRVFLIVVIITLFAIFGLTSLDFLYR